jgi:hypothetical protein
MLLGWIHNNRAAGTAHIDGRWRYYLAIGCRLILDENRSSDRKHGIEWDPVGLDRAE